MFLLTIASDKMIGVSNPRGFTLLEVMISVSILALIFVSLFRMQSGTIGLASAAKFDVISPLLAKKLLVKIDQDLSNWSGDKGDFGEQFPGIEWACSIMDSPLENVDFISRDNQDNLKKIEIEITGLSGQRSYKIITWRFAVE